MKFPADSVGTSKVVLKVNEQCGSSSPPQPPGLINWQAPLYIDRARHHLISALHPIYVYICELSFTKYMLYLRLSLNIVLCY